MKKEIDDQGAEIIVEFSKDSVHVIVIDLSLSNIGNRGSKAIVNALIYDAVVEELIISGNNLGQ